MEDKLYAVVRWMEDNNSGELSLELIGTHLSYEEAKQALQNDQEEQVKILDENDVEFTKGSDFDLEYQYDTDHNQYWEIAEIGIAMFDALEYQWICDYASSQEFDQEVCRNQLLSLWTAYCLHYDLWVDTKIYDTMASFLWTVVDNNNSGPWKNFEEFDSFLCEYLVQQSK